jgi:hypothetical protein
VKHHEALPPHRMEHPDRFARFGVVITITRSPRVSFHQDLAHGQPPTLNQSHNLGDCVMLATFAVDLQNVDVTACFVFHVKTKEQQIAL